MTPEHLYSLAPLIREQQQKNNFINRGGNATSKPSSSLPASSQVLPESVNAPLPPSLGENGFASRSQIEEYKGSIPKAPTFGEINALAKDILNDGITQDPQQATAMATQQLNQDLLSRQANAEAFQQDFSKRFALDLQGTGLNDYKDIAGEIQNALLDQGEYMVNQLGMSPQEASLKVSEIAKELGKTSNNVKEVGSLSRLLSSSSDKITALKSQRKTYEKYGFGELFDDLAAGQMGLTPMQIAHELDPLKNKDISKHISSLKTNYDRSEPSNLKDSTLDSMIKNITPKDNIYSIEYELREKGYSVNQFKQRVLELQDAREIALSPQQQRQLKRPVSNSFLGDILFKIFK